LKTKKSSAIVAAMQFQSAGSALLLLSCLLAGCQEEAPLPAPLPVATRPAVDPLRGHLLAAQPRLPAVHLHVGTNSVTAEVARMPVEIATGMMFRTNLPDGEGMLFVFPRPDQRSFYMRNCLIPLSGAYISPSGEILQLIDMKPHDERSIPSYSDDVQFVLEMPHGWFERHQIGVGAIVRSTEGTLQETFFRKP